MDVGTTQLVVWMILGAVGGFLHYIIPYPPEKEPSIENLIKRILAGVIVVPLVMFGGSQFIPPEMYVSGYFGQVIIGYFALDILSIIRQYASKFEGYEEPPYTKE